jgi:hypothetical protein
MRLVEVGVVMLILPLSGCIVHTKADTVLTFSHDPNRRESVPIGFRDAKWAVTDPGKMRLVGHGAFPREHETYAFFWSEGYPIRISRWVIVESEAPLSAPSIVIKWPSGYGPFGTDPIGVPVEYRGKASRGYPYKTGNYSMSLDNVPLYSAEGKKSVFVSGQILAKPASKEAVRQMMQQASETCP